MFDKKIYENHTKFCDLSSILDYDAHAYVKINWISVFVGCSISYCQHTGETSNLKPIGALAEKSSEFLAQNS